MALSFLKRDRGGLNQEGECGGSWEEWSECKLWLMYCMRAESIFNLKKKGKESRVLLAHKEEIMLPAGKQMKVEVITKKAM